MVLQIFLTVLVVVVVILALVPPAAATWSIVAVDQESGQVGVAMASCGSAAALGDADEVLAPIVLVPGRGAGVLQGTVRPSAVEEMAQLLTQPDMTGPRIVELLLAAEDDETLTSVRQYGVVVLGEGRERVGVHVGDDNAKAAGVGASSVAVQTVQTAGVRVGERTLSAFESARNDGLTFSGALVAALKAGADAGGDVECGLQRALFAQLAVAHPADDDGRMPSTLLTVTVDEDDGQNPVDLLVEAFDQGDRGWIDAGRRSPTLIPRWTVFLVGMTLAAASLLIIRKGMRMG